MSRIRSVHPGLFTDEAFMAASVYARLLVIGLWTEADDQGVFEWKPLTLKARLLPVDGVDVAALLQELELADFIRLFDHDGKSYGAIRNFRRFQRPQKPTPRHHLPESMRSYVGLSDAPTIAEEEPYDSTKRKSPQMEDEGRRREEVKEREDTVFRKNKNGAQPYAFEHGVVRLSGGDLERWHKAFPHISVEAELLSAEPWLAKQKSWFQAAAGMLAKREREMMRPATPEKPASGLSREGF